MSKFIYLGDGAFIPNVPARDLSEAEAERAGLEVLRNSPLYEEVKSKSTFKPKKEDVNERINEAQEDSAGS